MPGPGTVPRTLYRHSRALRAAYLERRFRTRIGFDAQAPELLLSPHLDDAVLDCWSVLSDERELNVVNIFAGIPAPGPLTLWDAITGAADSPSRATGNASSPCGPTLATPTWPGTAGRRVAVPSSATRTFS